MLTAKIPGGSNAHVNRHSRFPGVSDVQTNVETKKVVVTADDSVSPQDMLEKLQKVSWRVVRKLSALFVGLLILFFFGSGRKQVESQ